MNLNARIDRLIAEELARHQHTPHCNWCWVCPDCKSELVAQMVNHGACRVGADPGIAPVKELAARYIDHTLLKPEATRQQIEKLCQEAAAFEFASVCVNPTWVSYCSHLLRGSKVLVCTVVGFPLGANTTEVKAYETKQCVEQGACEIDMVINVGRLKSGEYDFIALDIHAVVEAAHPAHVKVILENCYLSDEEKIKACLLSREAGAHFVKTSTGFGPSGAKIEDVALMRRVVGEQLGVKAAGGIREYDTASKMIAAGASRLGASASIAILEHRKAA